MPEHIATDAVTFRKDGGLYQDSEGVAVKVAHFDRKKGHLELEKPNPSQRLMRQLTAVIGTVDEGRKPSGLVINSMAVKGQAADKPAANVPPKPKRDPRFGDQTPALVKWYFEHRPQEAYLRYGVFLDENGQPIRRTVKRKTTEIVDDRSGDAGLTDQNEGKGAQVGPKKWENGPVGQVTTQETVDNQIIARRATCLTYAPSEVVGGFEAGEDADGAEGEGESGEGGAE